MSSILTVSQLNNYLSMKLRGDPKLKGIAIKGEITNLNIDSRSGHIYFSLRDREAGIRAVIFASNAAKLRYTPFEGMAVVAYGTIDIYGRDGSCEIIISQLLPDGAGSAYMALLKLKEKLQSLGIFDAPKKPIPRYPEKIVVVTSPTGAALQDIKNIISRRYPLVKLELFPTAVQGVDAPASIVSALKKADESGADTIILTRGGGSSEDLSAFNTEAVTLAVASCQTPVISAVGHEIDWSLSDLAADLRAPTPSGAAELATPDILEIRREVSSISAMISHLAMAKVSLFRDALQRYEYALSALSVRSKISTRRAELEAINAMIKNQALHRLEVSRLALDSLCNMLDSLDPKNVLSRGYAMVYKGYDVVPDADKLSAGEGIIIVFRDGSAEATVNNLEIGDNDEV